MQAAASNMTKPDKAATDAHAGDAAAASGQPSAENGDPLGTLFSRWAACACHIPDLLYFVCLRGPCLLQWWVSFGALSPEPAMISRKGRASAKLPTTEVALALLCILSACRYAWWHMGAHACTHAQTRLWWVDQDKQAAGPTREWGRPTPPPSALRRPLTQAPLRGKKRLGPPAPARVRAPRDHCARSFG